MGGARQGPVPAVSRALCTGEYEVRSLSMDREQLRTTIVEYLREHYGGTLATLREDGNSQASGITYVSDGPEGAHCRP